MNPRKNQARLGTIDVPGAKQPIIVTFKAGKLSFRPKHGRHSVDITLNQALSSVMGHTFIRDDRSITAVATSKGLKLNDRVFLWPDVSEALDGQLLMT